jgi:hypothetical protein
MVATNGLLDEAAPSCRQRPLPIVFHISAADGPNIGQRDHVKPVRSGPGDDRSRVHNPT